MDPWTLFRIFGVVFVAELGDKTQLATVLFAADGSTSKWLVFAAASLALVTSTALAVLAGGLVTQFVGPRQLNLIAGSGFIAIGIWTLLAR